ncbi:MAG: biotin/lipoate A/B protein ligase family protein [Saccharolobus sp.]|jgi:lipoate-protein ligase A|uniref:lipoate--protein ligase family protein n=1 Tax=Saccharolobus sp. TaxID=2100761 RepID=UPI0028CF0574|nr:biotin/lipoate A/B protein ligase family protein [Saccharolobus sp.]MDT7861935.1 biotin/lipoate A/B protein ligase family protein [Saccharolobus sp.]
MKLRVLTAEFPQDPYLNIAVDEALLIKGRGSILRIWRNDKSVILGILSSIRDEVNLDFIRSAGIVMVRRISGGGTVFHDMGNINYTIIVDKKDDKDQLTGIDYLYGKLLKGTINAIKFLSNSSEIAVYNDSDITFKGYKVSGNAGYIYGNRYMLHGTLLISTDLNLMHKALIIPPKNIKRNVNMVKYKVNNLSALLNKEINYKDVIYAFTKSFSELLESEIYEDEINSEEIELAYNLSRNKYMREDFINKRP